MDRHEHKSRTSPTWFAVRPFALGVGSVVLTALLANELHTWATLAIDRLSGGTLWSLWNAGYALLVVVMLALSLFAWSRLAKEMWRPRTRGQIGRRLASEQPRSHLIVFLSNVIVDQNATGTGCPKCMELTESLDEDLGKLLECRPPFFWPWEQTLRAMRVHVPVLRAVYCICSKQSLSQAKWFVAIAKQYREFSDVRLQIVHYGPGIVRCVSAYTSTAGDREVDPAGFDFEDYDQLAPALRELLAQLNSEGVVDASITVDFTGGQKVTSVVAMTETYDTDVVAQYVQTGGNKNVYCYDVIFEKRRVDVPVK